MRKENGFWGTHLFLDLHSCNPKTIRDVETIRRYVKELCELVKVKRFGECVVVHFGKDEKIAGFSMTQLIETSLVSGHFVNLTNNAYIDIFSCKKFDTEKVAEFTKNFFEARDCNKTVLFRK